MTANRRIFLNIIATYGRSLFSLVCGLFTSRWMLLALGQVDFGLFGVVGGLVFFVSMFNLSLSVAVQRYYAFSIGEMKITADKSKGIERVREWFSIAVVLHFTLATLLMVVGYNAGIWAIKNFMTIPVNRLNACVWVFRFSCIACYCGMVNVPFRAMYTAKQYIAELTVYSFVQTIARVIFLYYMVSNPGDWLAWVGFWTCACECVPQIAIALRACFVFAECRFRPKAVLDTAKIRSIISFAGWNAFGTIGHFISVQGMAVMVNKVFGPIVNGALSVSHTVKGQASTLSSAMQGAFIPVITTSCGTGNMDEVRKWCFRMSKFAVILIMMFVLPLMMELTAIIRLWLKNPPPGSTLLCFFALATLLVDATSSGQRSSIYATGNIASFTMFAEGLLFLVLPLACLFVWLGYGIAGIGASYLIITLVNTMMRAYFARRIVGVSALHWFKRLVLPALGVIIVAAVVGGMPRFLMPESFFRMCCTIIFTESALLGSVWMTLLDEEDRQFVLIKADALCERFLFKGHGG